MTVTNALIRKRAQAMLRDPLYREFRGWHFNLGAKEAMETVRHYDRLLARIEREKPFTNREKLREKADD